MQLTEKEKKLLRGCIYMIQADMESNEGTTYFDDKDHNKFFDADDPNSYNDDDWEIADNWDDRNGKKIMDILGRIIADC